MKDIRSAALIPAVAAILAATPALAQDTELGKEIYLDRCSVCHGAEGGGDGVVGELLARRPKNLKLLAKDNGGEFPFEAVYQSIDGRSLIAGHGNPDMPIWGEFFMTQALEDRAVNPKDARHVVEGRILSVVYFIESLQVTE
ncbi:cytochrome c [Ostreiculturibacter nitratireducens]|uniref:cytochrome c n=1 Tax=Ostreiculturibacter nitratireducens TaxID=3075226 RepID=UPI0031B62E25